MAKDNKEKLEIRRDIVGRYSLFCKRTGQQVTQFDARYFDSQSLRDLADRIEADAKQGGKRADTSASDK